MTHAQIIQTDTFQPVGFGEFFHITPAGLLVQGAPSFDVCEMFGESLRTLDRGIQFALGDYFRYIEDRFGEQASQILDHTGWSESTLRTYRWTAEKIAVETRRMDRLSYRHHQLVAALPPLAQRKWLTEAAEGNGDGKPWTTARLQQAIKAGSDLEITKWYLVTRCTSEAQRDELLKELEGRGFLCTATEKRGEKKVRSAA